LRKNDDDTISSLVIGLRGY